MADVEALCRRVIVISYGKVIYDGALSGLGGQRFSPHKTIIVELEDNSVDLRPAMARWSLRPMAA